MAAGAGPDQVRYYGSRRAGTSGYQRGVHKGARKASGIDLRPPRRIHTPGEPQVIVAPDAVPVVSCPGTSARSSTPRIPRCPEKYQGRKREKSPCGGETAGHRRNRPCPLPVPCTAAGDSGPAPKTRAKGRKEDAIKRFVSTRIVRETEESPDAIIAKDELYQLFERWCRDHDYAAIPGPEGVFCRSQE